VLDPAKVCGPDTAFVNGACVGAGSPAVTCGAGTTEANGECVASLQSCGAGTMKVNGECVAAIQSCGPGTMTNGSECVTAGLTCGAGTAQVGSQCQVNLSAVCSTDTAGAGGSTCVGRVRCDAGTQRQGDLCVADFTAICANGTRQNAGRCVLDGATACGPGTVFLNGRCEVPTPVASLQTFSAASNLKVSYDHVVDTSATAYATQTLIITDLSQGSADAWASTWTEPVGQGAALHFEFRWEALSGCSSTNVCDSVTIPIVTSVGSNGTCDTTRLPYSRPGTGYTYANFFGWNLLSPTLAACATGGSVRIERLMVNYVDSARITLNIQFNDNSTWQDRVFVTPIR
jgi:hypothetical protein